MAAALAQGAPVAQGESIVTRWEYARLESTDRGISVVFTHHLPWLGLAPESFFDTLRRLGDEGWELVSALPLAAVAEGNPGQPGTHVQILTDRWLVFKRPKFEGTAPEPGAAATQGSDVVRDLAGQFLKSKLPVR